MTTHPNNEPAAVGIVNTLDEQQARDRAAVHSIGNTSLWHVVRGPAGWHVVIRHIEGDRLDDPFTIVATYRDGLEVTDA